MLGLHPFFRSSECNDAQVGSFLSSLWSPVIASAQAERRSGTVSDAGIRKEQLWSQLLENWLVVWNMNFMTFHILGMSSSQLTFIFFRGIETNNQKRILQRSMKSILEVTWKGCYNVAPRSAWKLLEKERFNLSPRAVWKLLERGCYNVASTAVWKLLDKVREFSYSTKFRMCYLERKAEEHYCLPPEPSPNTPLKNVKGVAQNDGKIGPTEGNAAENKRLVLMI